MTDQEKPPPSDRTLSESLPRPGDPIVGPTDALGVPTDRPDATGTSAPSAPSAPSVLTDEPVAPRRSRVRTRKEAPAAAPSSVRRTRELVASAVITVAVLAAATLALGAVLIALHANPANAIVSTVVDLADRLDGPFSDLFTFENEAVKQTLVNWGIAAVVYLIAGRIVERVLRP